jgi:hypothetical protein
MRSGLICVGCILILATLAGGQTLQKAQFLEFGKVTHQSTWNGQPATMPIYAGRNKAKILYAIVLKGQFTADLCVEVTTGFIGRFAPADFQIQGDLMLVNVTAVPKKADDLTLAVANTAEGYQLTIAKGADTLICKVPAPDDELDKLLKNPPANAPITPILTAGVQHFTGLEEKAAAVAQAQSGTSGPSNANIPSAMPVASANKTFHSEVLPVLLKMQDQRGSTITPITQQQPQGSGKKTFITPFPAAGTRHEKDTNWMASGLADKISGQVISTTQGIGYSDAKKRGENFSWMECRWNANKAGKLKATGTFVEIHATGLSSPPVFAMATSTAYLYVGVRNERTQKSIWQEYSLGRSPGGMIPFVNILPLRQVTASGLDVQNGDEIVFMVGVCDYSSAKAGAHAHGEANARVQVIEVEVN